MNRHTTVSFLIIASILLLALKDAASCIHTLLHYIPDNPWHQHEPHRAHTHLPDPLKMHIHLQHKHMHSHETHTHVHTHDVLDHIQPEHTAGTNTDDTSEEIKTDIKPDFYFQPVTYFYIPAAFRDISAVYVSRYHACLSEKDAQPPYQPPQV